MSIDNTAGQLYDIVRHSMTKLGVKGVEPHDIIDIIDEHTLGGHGCVNKELKGYIIMYSTCVTFHKKLKAKHKS